MITDIWPLFGLHVTTPRLELRVPDLDDLGALADVAAAGVHDPAVQPFVAEWTDGAPVIGRRLRLDRAGWAAARRIPVTVSGLQPCLPMFGLDQSTA